MDLKELRTNNCNRHPWEIAKGRFFKTVLEKHLGDEIRKNIIILDVGAGDGFFSESIAEKESDNAAKIYCWDINYSDDFINEKNKFSKIEYTKKVPNEKVDILLLMDVLEHVKNDRDFLNDLVSNRLKDHSNVLISVPAWNGLYSSHDKNLEHFRRYSPTMAKKIIDESGLQIIKSGGLFHSLIIPRFASLVKEKILGGPNILKDVGNWNHGSFLTNSIGGALSMDNALSRMFSFFNVDIPGLSWWALCKK